MLIHAQQTFLSSWSTMNSRICLENEYIDSPT